MARQKTGGRKKGTPNKITANTKQWIAGLLSDNRGKFAEMLEYLQPLDFVKVYLSLLSYEIPKRQAIGLQDLTPRELARQFDWSVLTEKQKEALESLPEVANQDKAIPDISINIVEANAERATD